MLRNQPIVLALAVVAGIMAVVGLVQSKGTSIVAWGLLAVSLAVVLLAL